MHGEVGIRRVLGNGQIGGTGVEVDRLSPHENDRITMDAEGLDASSNAARARTYRGSGTPGVLVGTHPRQELVSLGRFPASPRQQVGSKLTRRHDSEFLAEG